MTAPPCRRVLLVALLAVSPACSDGDDSGALTRASFDVSASSGLVPLTVTFTDRSQGATAWSWDFGNGEVSARRNPTTVYDTPGSYTVRLRVAGPRGSDLIEMADLVQAFEPTEAHIFASSDEGTVPFTVDFEDVSLGPPTSWEWDFGNGESSTLRDPPAQTYDEPGDYTVSLAVDGPGGADQTTRTIRAHPSILDPDFEEQPPGTLVAGAWTIFAGSDHVIRSLAEADAGMPRSGNQWCELSAQGSGPGGVPETGIEQVIRYPQGRSVLQLDAAFVTSEDQAAFNDLFHVDLSDGTTTLQLLVLRSFGASYLEAPSTLHPGARVTPLSRVTVDLAQAFPGSTSVTPFTLRMAVGNVGDDQNPSFGYVDGLRFEPPNPTPVEADFSQSVTGGPPPLTVIFTDESLAAPDSWRWVFGDGFGSNDASPSHTFTQEGDFTVRLDVTNTGSADSHNGRVVVSACPQAAFTPSTNSGPPGTVVSVTNQSTGSPDTYFWDFGDPGSANNTSGEENPPPHQYDAIGDYVISLTITGGKGCPPSDEATATIRIRQAPALASVSADPNPGLAGSGITMTAVAAGGSGPIDTYHWDFGDGTTRVTSTSSTVKTYSSGASANRTVQVFAQGLGGTSNTVSRSVHLISWTTIYDTSFGPSSRNCFSCHNDGQSSATFSTQTKNIMHANVFNVARTPENTCLSSLRVDPGSIRTLSALYDAVCCGRPSCLSVEMPNLSTGELDELGNWIELGATNN